MGTQYSFFFHFLCSVSFSLDHLVEGSSDTLEYENLFVICLDRPPIFPTLHKCQNPMIVLIMQLSGTPPSAFQVPYDSFKEKFESSKVDSSDMHSSSGELQERKPKDLDYDFICFFLSTQRLELYRSIDFRCEDMLLGKKKNVWLVMPFMYIFLRYTFVGNYSFARIYFFKLSFL